MTDVRDGPGGVVCMCIVGRSKRKSVIVSVVAVCGICTLDLITLFSMLMFFMVSGVFVFIVSFACVCSTSTSNLKNMSHLWHRIQLHDKGMSLSLCFNGQMLLAE